MPTQMVWGGVGWCSDCKGGGREGWILQMAYNGGGDGCGGETKSLVCKHAKGGGREKFEYLKKIPSPPKPVKCIILEAGHDMTRCRDGD